MVTPHKSSAKTILFCGSPSAHFFDLVASLENEIKVQGELFGIHTLVLDDRPFSNPETSPNTLDADVISYERLLSSRYSRECIGIYDSFAKSSRFAEIELLATKFLNRVDMTGTFRLLERETLFQAAVLWVAQFLLRSRPSLVIFPVTPHLFLPFVFMEVARFLQVKVLHFQPSPLAPVAIPILEDQSSEVYCQNPEKNSEFWRHITQQVCKNLSDSVGGIEPTYMRRQKNRDNEVSSLRARLWAVRRSLQWLLKDRYPESVDFSGTLRSGGVFRRAIKLWINRELQRNLKETVVNLRPQTVSSGKYCLFALHYEPERTSLPEGLPILAQIDAIVGSRVFVPADMTLLVKEHYSQTSSALRGYLGRSPDFYKLVTMMDGTELVPSDIDVLQLVAGAGCVITLTGTIAIEATMRGIPVAYFGSPWWAGMPGTFRLSDKTRFEEIVATKRPTRTMVSDYIVNKVCSAMIPWLGGEDPNSVEMRLGTLHEDFDEAERSGLLSSLIWALGKPNPPTVDAVFKTSP